MRSGHGKSKREQNGEDKSHIESIQREIQQIDQQIQAAYTLLPGETPEAMIARISEPLEAIRLSELEQRKRELQEKLLIQQAIVENQASLEQHQRKLEEDYQNTLRQVMAASAGLGKEIEKHARSITTQIAEQHNIVSQLIRSIRNEQQKQTFSDALDAVRTTLLMDVTSLATKISQKETVKIASYFNDIRQQVNQVLMQQAQEKAKGEAELKEETQKAKQDYSKQLENFKKRIKEKNKEALEINNKLTEQFKLPTRFNDIYKLKERSDKCKDASQFANIIREFDQIISNLTQEYTQKMAAAKAKEEEKIAEELIKKLDIDGMARDVIQKQIANLPKITLSPMFDIQGIGAAPQRVEVVPPAAPEEEQKAEAQTNIDLSARLMSRMQEIDNAEKNIRELHALYGKAVDEKQLNKILIKARSSCHKDDYLKELEAYALKVKVLKDNNFEVKDDVEQKAVASDATTSASARKKPINGSITEFVGSSIFNQMTQLQSEAEKEFDRIQHERALADRNKKKRAQDDAEFGQELVPLPDARSKQQSPAPATSPANTSGILIQLKDVNSEEVLSAPSSSSNAVTNSSASTLSSLQPSRETATTSDAPIPSDNKAFEQSLSGSVAELLFDLFLHDFEEQQGSTSAASSISNTVTNSSVSTSSSLQSSREPAANSAASIPGGNGLFSVRNLTANLPPDSADLSSVATSSATANDASSSHQSGRTTYGLYKDMSGAGSILRQIQTANKQDNKGKKPPKPKRPGRGSGRDSDSDGL